MADEQSELAKAYERVREANRKLDEAWQSRLSDPKQFRLALDELNEAGADLSRVGADA